MKDQRDLRLKETLRELAADFFSKRSNRQSLITVTDILLGNRGTKAKILLSVLPESAEEAVLDFTHRQLTEFRNHVKENSRIGIVPYFEVAIDRGEKNRQKIDELSRNV